MQRALVVDDNFANRQLLIELLNGKFICDVAVNGLEAEEAYHMSVENDKFYDLILLDVAMPEVDGLDCLRAIRVEEKKRNITLGDGVAIIMVTAHEEMFMKAFREGCDDYILKPIDPPVLFQKIEKLLEGRKRKGS